MKLVEILALELKEWPVGAEYLTQSAIDDELYKTSLEDNDCLKGTRSLVPKVELGQHHTEGAAYPHVSRAEWQAAVDALGIPKFPGDAVEWNGEGLPPVGCVCESASQDGVWKEVIIIAHDEGKAVCRLNNEDKLDYFGWPRQCFRPIRTPEQIAAEERKAGIKQICIDAGSPDMTPGQMSVAAKLYDAGYRKQEQK